MLVNDLKTLRDHALDQFCAVMEFKAFSQLAYILGSERAQELPRQTPYMIRYSVFTGPIGLPDKTLQASELAEQFSRAGNVHLLPLVHQYQVALFESIFFDALHLLLADQPLRLPSKRQIEYSVITNAQTKEEIVLTLIERELNELSTNPFQSGLST